MMHRRWFCSLLTLAAGTWIFGSAALAEEKPSLSGTWQMQGGEMKMEFGEKNSLKLMPHGAGDVITFVCEYSLGKGGLVKAKVTELQGTKKDQVKDKFPEGSELSFKWIVQGTTALLEDVKGEAFEAFKSHLEGKFDKK